MHPDDRESALIANIHSGRFSERELINLYNNAARRGSSGVMHAVQVQMRADFPRAANRMFGAKESEAVSLLEGVFHTVSESNDLSRNRVRNGVKAGGRMLSGEKHIDVYVSYKNDVGLGTYLTLSQDAPDAELTATVGRYKTGNDGFRDEQVFQMHDFDRAVERYKAELVKVLAGA